MLLLDGLLFLVGLALLALGAEALVRGGSGLAARMGVSPLVVGLTVVAMGTTMPEFVVSVLAALQGNPGVAMGNVVGSNILNTLLVLGVVALIAPVRLARPTMTKDIPVVLAIGVVALLLCLDGFLSRGEGFLLLLGVVPFLVYAYRREARRAPSRRDGAAGGGGTAERPVALLVLAVLGGAVMLAVGAHGVVTGGVSLARVMGVSDRVIGLTLVALGTSLPELATGVVAALRGRSQLAVGNVLGANALNLLLTLGMAAAVRPFVVPAGSLALDLPVMLGALVLLLVVAWPRQRLGRGAGVVLLAGYAVYLLLLVGALLW